MDRLEAIKRVLQKRFISAGKVFSRRPYLAAILLVAAIGVGSFFLAPSVFAQTNSPGPLDSLLILLAGFAVTIAGVIGQLIVLLLDVLTLPLMTYNGFASSPVVGAGWSIVRDVVNMFFVIVLIVIAFGTIFGNSRFQWQQQVPRLLLFAVLINFSRSIAGLLIDAAQVLMFTFVNAFKDIAGGNFVELFGLRSIIRVSQENPDLIAAANGQGTGFNAFDWFGAGILSVVMMVIVAATVVAMTVVFAWRIVMLWVLIVIAPMAWFMGGAKGIVNTADAVYADWWKQFICYIAIGPVLAFFLWLTLAVAGGGNIVASDSGFSQVAAQETTLPAVLEIFELDRITAFIIGIAMIFAGFRAAQSVCSGVSESILPAVLGKAEGFAKGAVKATVRAPVAAVGGAAGLGVAGAKRAGSLGLAAGKKGFAFADKYTGASSFAKQQASTVVGKVGTTIGGKIGGSIGRYVSSEAKIAESNIAGAAAKGEYERTGAAKALAAGPDVAAARLRQLLDNKGSLNDLERTEAAALLSDSLSNGDLKKELDKDGIFDHAFKEFGLDQTDNKGNVVRRGAESIFAGDSARVKSFKDYRKTRPDLDDSLKTNGVLDPVKLASRYREWDDVKQLDGAALADPGMQAFLQTIKTGDQDRDGNLLNAYQAFLQNKAGNSKREAIESSQPRVRDAVDTSNYDITSGKFKPGKEYLQEVVANQLQANFTDIGQIPHNALLEQNGNNALSLAAQKAITKPAIESLFRRYQEAALKGDKDTQYDLQNAIDNAHFVVERAAETGDREKQNLLRQFEKTKKNVESRASRVVIADPVEQITVQNQLLGKLRSITTEHTALAKEYKDQQVKTTSTGDQDPSLQKVEADTKKIAQLFTQAIGAIGTSDAATLAKIQKELAEAREERRTHVSAGLRERPEASAARAKLEAQEEQFKRHLTNMINAIGKVQAPKRKSQSAPEGAVRPGTGGGRVIRRPPGGGVTPPPPAPPPAPSP